jgi:hypothetical protein
MVITNATLLEKSTNNEKSAKYFYDKYFFWNSIFIFKLYRNIAMK